MAIYPLGLNTSSRALATRSTRPWGLAYSVLGPVQDALRNGQGLLIIRFRDLSTRSWITTPYCILRQSCGGIEICRPGEPGILHHGDEPGHVMRLGKHDAALYQDNLDAFFDGLLRVETQRGQEDVRGMPLPVKGRDQFSQSVLFHACGAALEAVGDGMLEFGELFSTQTGHLHGHFRQHARSSLGAIRITQRQGSGSHTVGVEQRVGNGRSPRGTGAAHHTRVIWRKVKCQPLLL